MKKKTTGDCMMNLVVHSVRTYICSQSVFPADVTGDTGVSLLLITVLMCT